jgi:hypothetical protein
MSKIPFFHVGQVVDDIADAMACYTEALTLSWYAPQRRAINIETPESSLATDAYFVYSVEGPPHLELIESRARTPWASPGLHHLGLWGDVSADASARLISLGCPRETVLLSDTGDWVGGLFHILPNGLRLEIVNSSEQESLADLVSVARLTNPAERLLPTGKPLPEWSD